MTRLQHSPLLKSASEILHRGELNHEEVFESYAVSHSPASRFLSLVSCRCYWRALAYDHSCSCTLQTQWVATWDY